MEENIIKSIFEIGKTARENAIIHGFSDTDEQDEKALLLIHSEVSEVVESLRHGNPNSDHIPGFSGIEEELADIILRTCSYAYTRNFKLGEAILAKIKFNANREYKHGGKAF